MSDPNWSNVSLLAHFNGTNGATTFTEETGKTLTAFGNAQLTTAQQKYGTASLALDGTGDYVTTPSHTDFDFGTGDFTIEFWVRFNVVTGSKDILGKRATNGSFGSFLFRTTNARLGVYISSDGTSWGISNDQGVITSASTATWYHVALTRSGTQFRLYKDGVHQAGFTSASAVFFDSTALSLGAAADGSGAANVWLDDVRISKGLARYTGTGSFTVPVEFEGAPPGSDSVGTPSLSAMTVAAGAPGAQPALSAMTAAAYAAYGSASFAAMTALGATPAAGTATSAALQGAGYAHFGAPFFRGMEASGVGSYEIFGAGTFAPATASGEGIAGSLAAGVGLLEAMTATGTGLTGSTGVVGQFVTFERMTATGVSVAASAARGSGTMASLTAVAYGPMSTDISFEDMTASGVGLTGTAAAGAPRFALPVVAGTNVGGSVAAGTASFPYPTAAARGAENNTANAAVSFESTRGAVVSINGTISYASPRLKAMVAAGASRATNIATGAATFEKMRVT